MQILYVEATGLIVPEVDRQRMITVRDTGAQPDIRRQLPTHVANYANCQHSFSKIIHFHSSSYHSILFPYLSLSSPLQNT
jgi:hypothetical protein